MSSTTSHGAKTAHHDLVDSASFIECRGDSGQPERIPPVAELSDEEVLNGLVAMYTTRRVDTESIRLQRQGQLGVYPSCHGQEGAQIGAALALDERDWVRYMEASSTETVSSPRPSERM